MNAPAAVHEASSASGAGIRLAMGCWALGPLPVGLMIGLPWLADSPIEPWLGVTVTLMSLLLCAGLFGVVLCALDASMRRCFEGRCVLLWWSLLFVHAIAICVGLALPTWLIDAGTRLWMALIVLPPIVFALRRRRAVGYGLLPTPLAVALFAPLLLSRCASGAGACFGI